MGERNLWSKSFAIYSFIFQLVLLWQGFPTILRKKRRNKIFWWNKYVILAWYSMDARTYTWHKAQHRVLNMKNIRINFKGFLAPNIPYQSQIDKKSMMSDRCSAWEKTSRLKYIFTGYKYSLKTTQRSTYLALPFFHKDVQWVLSTSEFLKLTIWKIDLISFLLSFMWSKSLTQFGKNGIWLQWPCVTSEVDRDWHPYCRCQNEIEENIWSQFLNPRLYFFSTWRESKKGR